MRRYLWAQGTVSEPLEAGTVLAQRYQVIEFPLLLDALPADPPLPLETVPPLADPYLALSPFAITIPRPFTQIVLPQTGDTLLLLEAIPIQPADDPASQIPSLLPSMPAVWSRASALQQITWLWQIARLWQPLVDNQVADTLLDWENVRVDGEDIRLLCLQITESSPTLADLGHHWQPLVKAAARPWQDFLRHLVESLIAGNGTSAGLVNALTKALETIAAPQELAVQLATYSDRGPTRKRNEDACYPKHGTVGRVSLKAATVKTTPAPFVIVCDGIGGHQGGNVASQIAIDEVSQQLQALGTGPDLIHDDLVFLLEKAILAANQAISSRNDAAQRQERARMGTTIVVAFVYGARLYIAHLGDSRAYRVRSHNCRQITLDDDVATREMRLGLALYHDALQASGSGALVQALGMANSRHLHPSVELYPITQESVFLLCSDGLSDQDLVERLWTTELQPMIGGKRDIATAGKRLITAANTHNGHDNVTVGLLRVVPVASKKEPTVPINDAALLTAPVVSTSTVATQEVTTAVAAPAPTTPANVATGKTAPKRWQPLPILFSTVAIASLLGIGGAYAWRRFAPQVRNNPLSPKAGETLSPQASPPVPVLDPATNEPTTDNASKDGLSLGNEDLSVGDYLEVQPMLAAETVATVIVTATPPVPAPPPPVDLPKRILGVGSIVQVINRQKTPDNKLWVRLEVCSVSAEAVNTDDVVASSPSPTANTDGSNAVREPSLPLALPGDQGWLLQTSVSGFADRLLDTSPTQQGLCTN